MSLVSDNIIRKTIIENAKPEEVLRHLAASISKIEKWFSEGLNQTFYHKENGASQGTISVYVYMLHDDIANQLTDAEYEKQVSEYAIELGATGLDFL